MSLNMFENVAENGAEKLLKAVFHDVRKKPYFNITVLEKATGEHTTSSQNFDSVNSAIYWANHCPDVAKMKEPGVYFCQYPMTSRFVRKSESAFSLNAIRIDIDYSGDETNKEELEKALESFKEITNALWEIGTFATPSAICYTGRGYALYYILKQSIAAQSKNTKKAVEFFDRVQNLLIKAYNNILAETDMHADAVVTDHARLCRLPGTLNYRTNTECVLYENEVTYYSLTELYELNGLVQYEDFNTAVKKNEKFEQKIVRVDELKMVRKLKSRIAALFNLIDSINENGCPRGQRELVLFLIYNFAKQIYTLESAQKLTREANSKLLNSIDEARLVNETFAGPECAAQGYYAISDSKLFEKLGLDIDQVYKLGFGGYKAVRAAQKAHTTNVKETIKKLAGEAVKVTKTKAEALIYVNKKLEESNELLRNGKVAHISRRTLYRILDDLNNNAKKTTAEIENDKAVRSVPKIATVYSDVCLSPVADILFAKITDRFVKINPQYRLALSVFKIEFDKKSGKAFSQYKQAYLTYLLNYYIQHSQLNENDLRLLFQDLNYFYLSMRAGKRLSTGHVMCHTIPMSEIVAYKNGPIKELTYTVPAPVVKKTEGISITRFTSSEIRIIKVEARRESFLAWISEHGYNDTWDALNKLVENTNNEELRRRISTIHFARKNQRLLRLFDDLTDILRFGIWGDGIVSDSIEKMYAGAEWKLVESNRTSEQRKLAGQNYDKWQWIMRSRDSEYKDCKGSFKTLNGLVRGLEKTDSVLIDGIAYKVSEVKAILYRTTVDTIKTAPVGSLAATLSYYRQQLEHTVSEVG